MLPRPPRRNEGSVEGRTRVMPNRRGPRVPAPWRHEPTHHRHTPDQAPRAQLLRLHGRRRRRRTGPLLRAQPGRLPARVRRPHVARRGRDSRLPRRHPGDPRRGERAVDRRPGPRRAARTAVAGRRPRACGRRPRAAPLARRVRRGSGLDRRADRRPGDPLGEPSTEEGSPRPDRTGGARQLRHGGSHRRGRHRVRVVRREPRRRCRREHVRPGLDHCRPEVLPARRRESEGRPLAGEPCREAPDRGPGRRRRAADHRPPQCQRPRRTHTPRSATSSCSVSTSTGGTSASNRVPGSSRSTPASAPAGSTWCEPGDRRPDPAVPAQRGRSRPRGGLRRGRVGARRRRDPRASRVRAARAGRRRRDPPVPRALDVRQPNAVDRPAADRRLRDRLPARTRALGSGRRGRGRSWSRASRSSSRAAARCVPADRCRCSGSR